MNIETEIKRLRIIYKKAKEEATRLEAIDGKNHDVIIDFRLSQEGKSMMEIIEILFIYKNRGK